MDAAIIGLLTMITSAIGIWLWLLLARPAYAVDLWIDRPLTDSFEDMESPMLPLMRWLTAILFVASSFGVGVAVAFLSH